MTDKQIAMVEKEMPYIDYMLKKLIPYVPEQYKEDVRQIALLALCEFICKENPRGDELPRYAYRRVRRYVLQYLINEDKYRKLIDGSASDEKSHLVEKGTMIDPLQLQNLAFNMLDPFSKYRDRDMQVCSLLLQGYKPSEIADATGLTINQVNTSKKRIRRGIEVEIKNEAV